MGDSITAKIDFNELLGIQNSVNRGIGSDTTLGVLERLPQIERLKPKKLFLMIGINDLALSWEPEKIMENYEKILESLHAKSKDTYIYCESVLPVATGNKIKNEKVREFNQLIEAAVSKKDYCCYLDFYSLLSDESGALKKEYTSDGVHLLAEGYRKIGEELIKYIDLQ